MKERTLVPEDNQRENKMIASRKDWGKGIIWWYLEKNLFDVQAVEYVNKIHFFFCHNNGDLEQTAPWESAPCLRQKQRRGKSREKKKKTLFTIQ